MKTNIKQYLNNDKNVKSWLTWKYLFDCGLNYEEINNDIKNKIFMAREFFRHSEFTKENIINRYLEKDYHINLANNFTNLLLNNNISNLLYVFDEMLNIKHNKNTSILYWIDRGWDEKEAKIKLKNFFIQGALKTKENCLKSIEYKNKFIESRKAGGLAIINKFKYTNKSNFQNILEKTLINKGYSLSSFYSSCIDPLIFNKNNFIHDYYINDELIVEFNGTYWHKDFLSDKRFTEDEYLYELRKAYNCIELIKRKKKKKYLILWENDINNDIELAIKYIDAALKSNKYFHSSREKDIEYYNVISAKIKKEERSRKLFSDICLRFAEESHCLSKKVAAIAVCDGHIVATGINGTLKDMINCDEYWKIYHKENNISINFEDWIKTTEWRELHHDWSNINEVHAEMSLLLEAVKYGIKIEDCDIYCSLEPCSNCAKTLAGLKPKNIFYINSYDKSDLESKYLLKSFGINYKKLKCEQI